MRVKSHVDPVPEAGRGGDGLAAAALDGQRCRNLVRGAPEDDDRAPQLATQLAEGEGRGQDACRDGVVSARVDGLDRPRRPEDRHRVVERDEADRAA
jgi:hypothetical protein